MSVEIDIIIPKPHPAQLQILHGAKRYNLIKCGRRFGKTELIAELTQEIVLKGYPVGIFCPIERDFLKTWERLKYVFRPIIQSKNEQYHFMTLINGGIIDMWSMAAVDNGRGEKYKRVIMDEFAKAPKGKQSWEQTIRATLSDHKGDAWFLSTPKGKSNYFYQLQEKHKKKSNWAFWKFTSYDNPYLDSSEIEDAKETLDPISFQQEYLAEDVDANEKPFLYCFDENKHVSNHFTLDDSLPLWLSFDFNVLPQTCVIGQRLDDDTLNVCELIRLDNASIYEMCDHIKVKYPDYYLITTGDASGKARQGTTNRSYWAIIRDELSLSDNQIQLRGKNLDHRTSQVICNSVLTHKNITIHENCRELIQDCTYASTDEHGKLIKTVDRGLHFFDGFRYLLDANWPNVLKVK